MWWRGRERSMSFVNEEENENMHAPFGRVADDRWGMHMHIPEKAASSIHIIPITLYKQQKKTKS